MSNSFLDDLNSIKEAPKSASADRPAFHLKDFGYFTVVGKLNPEGQPYKRSGELAIPSSPSKTLSFDFKGTQLKNVGVYCGTLYKKPFVFNMIPISPENFVLNDDGTFSPVIPTPPAGKTPLSQRVPLLERFEKFIPKEMYRKFKDKVTGEMEMSENPVPPRVYPSITIPLLMTITTTEFVDDEEVTTNENLVVLFTQSITNKGVVDPLKKSGVLAEDSGYKEAVEYLFGDLANAEHGSKLYLFRHPLTEKGEGYGLKLLPDKQPAALAPLFEGKLTEEIEESSLERTILLEKILGQNPTYGTDKTSPTKQITSFIYEEIKALRESKKITES
jgi:hypothetical protein